MELAPSAPVPRSPRLTKNQKIGAGLLLTILGLFLVAVLFPTSPTQLRYALPVAAVGLLALWVGGILMGIGSRS
jgi:hypothetical protein